MNIFLSHLACAIKFFVIFIGVILFGGLFWMVFFGTGYILGYAVGNVAFAIVAASFWGIVFIFSLHYILMWAFDNSSC